MLKMSCCLPKREGKKAVEKSHLVFAFIPKLDNENCNQRRKKPLQK
jgi:hypothetical protein